MATVGALITEFRRLIQDQRAPYRYSDSVARDLMYQAAVLALAHNPQLAMRTELMTLAPGARQMLPSPYVRSFTMRRNMGSNGATPGAAISRFSRTMLDAVAPEWMTDPAEMQVRQYALDPSDPAAVYVYPPNSGGQRVQVSYSFVPEPLAPTATEPLLPAPYDEALPYGMAAAALTPDSDDPLNEQKRQLHMAEFLARLGVANAAA